MLQGLEVTARVEGVGTKEELRTGTDFTSGISQRNSRIISKCCRINVPQLVLSCPQTVSVQKLIIRYVTICLLV